MLRYLRGWPPPAPILAAAAALDFGVVTYMIVRRLHPPPPGSRAPPQVTRRMAAAVLAVTVSPACALLGGPRVVCVASAGDFRMQVEPLVEHRGRIWAEDPRRGGLSAAPGGARAGKRGYAGAGDCH